MPWGVAGVEECHVARLNFLHAREILYSRWRWVMEKVGCRQFAL